MQIIYDNFFLKHNTGDFHPENAERLASIKKYIGSSELAKKITFISPSSATVEQVCMVHTMDYIDKVKKLSQKSSLYYLDPDTVVSPDTYDCAMLAAGGCLNGIDLLLKDNKSACEALKCFFALIRPPGHHAFPSAGSGFCIFNNISIAARYAINNHGLNRIAIIDFDVHHGNGTQDIFYEDSRVFYASIHQYPHYPGTGYWTETGANRGQHFNLNIPVTAYSEESDYIIAFTDIIIPLLFDYGPELILVSAGFDAHAQDPLSSVNLKDGSYYKLMKLIILLNQMINSKIKSNDKSYCHGIGLFLEGGYNIDATSRSVLKVIEACIGHNKLSDNTTYKSIENKYHVWDLKTLKKNMKHLKSEYLEESDLKPGLNLSNLKTFDNIKNIFNLSKDQ